MVEGGFFEAFDLVAARAVVFELPEMRVFRVTFGALSERDSAETPSLVATRAKETFVFPQQGESRGRMVEFRLTPRSLRVASLAIDPQSRSMRVLVAVGAGFEGDSAETLSLVATRAKESFVFPQQGESRGRMIEFRLSPRRLRVAPLAIGPQARSMPILVAVSATGESKPFPLLVRMALLALDLSMGAHQAEAGAFVIEPRIAKRPVDGVAVAAARPQASPMRVLVAGAAAAVVQQKRRGLPARGSVRRPMTGVAGRDLEMEAFERIPRFPVIESAGIPTDEGEVHSLVIGVAGYAVRLSAVKPAAGRDPGTELRVTGEAFVVGDSLSGRVARSAVGKPRELRVDTAQRPRGDQGVELLRVDLYFSADPRETYQKPPSFSHPKRSP